MVWPHVTRDITRRAVLKQSAVGPLGLAALAAQDEPSRARVNRRMAFREPASLSDDYVRRVILLTDRHRESPDMAGVADCAFSNWPPDRLTLWEGLIVEWQNRGFGEILTADPEVRAERLVETRIVVDEQETPIELGTPFIVGERIECPGEYVGVNASEVPGLRIKTPPSVDTDG